MMSTVETVEPFMNENLCDILENADWGRLVPKLENCADWRIRQLHWRGSPAGRKTCTSILVDGKSVGDFVNDAIKTLLADDRSYNFHQSLEFNLKGIIRSLISNHKKKSDRRPLCEPKNIATDDGQTKDIIENAVDPNSWDPEKNERLAAQRRLLTDFAASIANDHELSLL